MIQSETSQLRKKKKEAEPHEGQPHGIDVGTLAEE